MPDLQLDMPQSDVEILIDYVLAHGVRRKLQAEARRAMADADKVEWQDGRWKPAQATTPWHFEWPGGGLQVGPLTYEMLDAADYEDFFSRYMRGCYGWALADLGKPGLENTGVEGFALQAYADSVSTEKSRSGVSRKDWLTLPSSLRPGMATSTSISQTICGARISRCGTRAAKPSASPWNG